MSPKIKKAAECIEARGWAVRAELVRAGIAVTKPIDQSIQELKRRLPRVRHKAEKEQIQSDLLVLREAFDEAQLQEQQAAAGRAAS